MREEDLIALIASAQDPDISWDYHFSAQAISALVAKLHPLKTDKSWVERQLQDAATSFVKWVLRGPDRLSRPKTRRELIDISEAATALANRLEHLHDDPKFLLQLEMAAARPGSQGLPLYGAYLAAMRSLAQCADVASKGSHINKTGPEKEFDVGYTVKILMDVFKQATGKAPTFYYRPSEDGKTDEPGSAFSDFMAVFFELLPSAELAPLEGIGPVPDGPPRTAADAMAAAGFDRRLLKIVPNRVLRGERHAQSKKAKGA